MKARTIMTAALALLLTLQPLAVTAQEMEETASPPIWRRAVLGTIGAAVLGSAAAAFAKDQEGSLCTSKTCIVVTASVIGGSMGYFLGREMDEGAFRDRVEGPTMDFGLRSTGLRGTPVAMIGHEETIVTLTREEVGVVDRDLRFRPLLRTSQARAAAILPGSEYLVVASNEALLGLPVNGTRRDPDTLVEGGGASVAGLEADVVVVGEPGRIRRLMVSASQGSVRELGSTSVEGLTTKLWPSDDGSVLWGMADSLLVARDAETLATLGSLKLPGRVRDLTVSGRTGVVSLGPDGAVVVNLTEAANPSVLAMLKGPEFAYSGAVLDGRAYVAAGPQGVFVYDLSTPSQPRSLGVVREVGFAGNVLAHEGRLYIMDRERNQLLRADGLR